MAQVTVDVDLDEFDDDEILEAAEDILAARRKKGGGIDSGSDMGAAFNGLTSWDLEGLAAAVCSDDGRRVLDILRPVFLPQHHAPTREVFEALPRDPQTGRPVH